MRTMINATAVAILSMLGTVATAYAQETVTRCSYEFGKYVCRSEQASRRSDPMQAGQDSFDRAYKRTQQMRDDAEARRAASAEQREADARAAAQQAADRTQAETRSVDQRLAAERQRLEAIEIVKRYIAAGQCADAKRVALEFFGAQGEHDATELCPG